jgi:hypothetical protein
MEGKQLMKFEMELHPNFVSEIVVKQLQEMYDHTKYHWFDTDPEEARAAIALVLDYFMPPSDYEQWRADNGFDRILVDEVVKGFDQLKKEREWVYLTEEEMLHIVTRDGMQLAEAIEAKIRAKNG